MATLVERFRERLLAKLPEGLAFRRDHEGYFFKLFAALAQEFARIDQRGTDLLADAAPWESVELLTSWETVFALPSTGTLLERQTAVAARLLDQGGVSIPYYTALAATLGYTVWIDEYQPWACGISSCIDPLYGTAWANTWTVHYITGGPNDAALEDALIRARPDHTFITFERHFYPTIDGNYLSIDGNRVFI